MSPVRIGVIGCGGHATLFQLPAVRQSSRAALVAVVDSDEQWCRKVAKRFNVPQWYTDARALVGQVDAAVIVTPNFTHTSLATMLLDNGVHVLCEKPVCTSVGELDAIVASADRSGARFMAAHCLRFSPNLMFLKRIIDEGWLGEVREIRAAIGGPYEQATHRTDFRRDRRAAGGGVLADLGVHVIDASLWLMGQRPVVAEYAAEFVRGWDVEDNASLVLGFPNARAWLRCSFTEFLSNTLTVRGDYGWAQASLYAASRLEVFNERLRPCRSDGVQTILCDGAPMFAGQIDHFCEFASGGELRVPTDQVRTGIEIVQQCYQTPLLVS